ncbi:MAG: energy-coupling factor transporter transmembrane protein EcfT [Lachnospiraceae bacterium]|nr:energy-coupling factor transporter transmembrane protein EcfT [Lachnospiraceae bacterium]
MERYHPIVNFIYFCGVIGCSMFLMHPVCLAFSTIGAFIYVLRLFGWTNARKGFDGLFVLMLLTAIMNPAFSHQGITILTYLPTGNVLTLESIFYGIAAAFMLASSVMWFRCMSEIITSDKIVYLFGRWFPVLSLVLSMILGFVPKLHRKLQEIRRCRGTHVIENLSILITWALDDVINMTDSMKGRGYGLAGRTSYTIYRFTKRDGIRLMLFLSALVYIIVGCSNDGLVWDYYPKAAGSGFRLYSVSIYLVYGWLCMFPVIEECWEERRWNKLQSKI